MKKESLQKYLPVLEPLLVELPGHLVAPMEVGMSALLPVAIFVVAHFVMRIPLFPCLLMAGLLGGVAVGISCMIQERRRAKERRRLLRELDAMRPALTDEQSRTSEGNHGHR